jgi:hypothetical protein
VPNGIARLGAIDNLLSLLLSLLDKMLLIVISVHTHISGAMDGTFNIEAV